MHRIMIVDDESIIREGLIKHINWNKYGYEIVGEAENGRKALELAQILNPQIILTDIYMPIMDGIEFAQEVRNILPDVVIIFLSGYNEFTYAQRAIRIGVFRYLTKPIKEEELIAALEDASKDLEYKELEKSKIRKLKLLIKDSLPLLKERFFINLVKGRLREAEITSKLSYLNINIRGDRFCCMIISLDDYYTIIDKQGEDDINLLKFAIQNMAEEILSRLEGCAFFFEDKRSDIGVLFCYNSKQESNCLSILYPAIQELQECVRRYLKTTVSVGIGRIFETLAGVGKSFEEAEDCMEYRTAYGKNGIIYIGDIKPADKNVFQASSFQKLNELIKAVKSGNIDTSYNIISETFDILKKQPYLKKDHIHFVVVEIIAKLIQAVLEFDGDISEVYGEKFSPFSLLNFDTIEDIQKKLKQFVGSTIEFINSKRRFVNKNFIEKAKEFINENYAIEGLNLSMIADSVFVSSGYLSQLFKQVVGESCVEYITKVRMNQAKKLLKDTMLKTYEVAEKVGYSDAQYFSTCFKKYTGVSPTDYRDIISKDLLDG